MSALMHKVLGPDDGLRLQSGPGRDLIFKVTGDDTGGAFDYFVVEVAPTAVRRSMFITGRRRRFTSCPAVSRCGSATMSSRSTPVGLRTSHLVSHTRSST